MVIGFRVLGHLYIQKQLINTKNMKNEENEIIKRYPGMVLVPVGAFFYYKMHKNYNACNVLMCISLLVLSTMIYIGIICGSIDINVTLCVFAVNALILLPVVFLMRRMEVLASAGLQVKQYATHVELFCQHGRKLRRVYKDGRLGLMVDSTFELELPVGFHEIVWLHGATYLTKVETDDVASQYEEGRGF